MSKASKYVEAMKNLPERPEIQLGIHFFLASEVGDFIMPGEVEDLSPSNALALADWIYDTFGENGEEVDFKALIHDALLLQAGDSRLAVALRRVVPKLLVIAERAEELLASLSKETEEFKALRRAIDQLKTEKP